MRKIAKLLKMTTNTHVMNHRLEVDQDQKEFELIIITKIELQIIGSILHFIIWMILPMVISKK